MSTALFNLVGRTALVTGSSRGLGNAIAAGLAAAGARLIINGTDHHRLSAAATALREKGYDVTAAPFDVTDENAVGQAFAKFDSSGIAIDTNLTSAFLVGREVARRMISRGTGGKVINIGSLTSEVARATVAPYTAAKGGLKLLTRAMAAEWAEHGIQANAIGPGYMVTEMNQALLENASFDAWVKGRTPRTLRITSTDKSFMST